MDVPERPHPWVGVTCMSVCVGGAVWEWAGTPWVAIPLKLVNAPWALFKRSNFPIVHEIPNLQKELHAGHITFLSGLLYSYITIIVQTILKTINIVWCKWTCWQSFMALQERRRYVAQITYRSW